MREGVVTTTRTDEDDNRLCLMVRGRLPQIG